MNIIDIPLKGYPKITTSEFQVNQKFFWNLSESNLNAWWKVWWSFHLIVKLPWLFSGAPENIQGNLNKYDLIRNLITVTPHEYHGNWAVWSRACSGLQQRMHESMASNAEAFICRNVFVYLEAPKRTAHDALKIHYNDVIMCTMASQITSLNIVYSTVYSGADQRKHQSSASLAFVRGIHRWPANSPQKGPLTRKMFPFDDVIMLKMLSLY